MFTGDFSSVDFNAFNSDSVSLLLSIISILMSFILTTATYLLGIGVPQIRTQSLSSKIRKDNVIYDLNQLLLKKKNISKYMILIYSLTFFLILIPIVLYTLGITYTRLILFIPLLILSTIFIILIVNISRITTLSLSIDEQLLEIEKHD